MLKTRLIAVLVVRDGQVVQSVRFRHTNVIHADPVHAMDCFNKWAVDEIVILNVSRSADSKEAFVDVVARICESCFVPVAVGGWIDEMAYAEKLLGAGADKLVVNTVLADDPELVTALSERYGRQCVVASMDVKKNGAGVAQVTVDRGTRPVFDDPAGWAARAEALGAGEILFNSIDHDGARRGYDLATIRSIVGRVTIPVIAFGGVMRWEGLIDGLAAGADAVAVANQFHYTEHATKKAKKFLADAGVVVRKEGQ